MESIGELHHWVQVAVLSGHGYFMHDCINIHASGIILHSFANLNCAWQQRRCKMYKADTLIVVQKAYSSQGHGPGI